MADAHDTAGRAIDAFIAAVANLNACVARCKVNGISPSVYVDGNYRVSAYVQGDLEPVEKKDA